MIWTEEAGVLLTLARSPKVSIKRSALVREARLVNKVILGMDADVSVTNAAVDTLVAQKLVDRVDGGMMLNLAGAKVLLSLSQRTQMLNQALAYIGSKVATEQDEEELECIRVENIEAEA
jgi:hypothetical protein